METPNTSLCLLSYLPKMPRKEEDERVKPLYWPGTDSGHTDLKFTQSQSYNSFWENPRLRDPIHGPAWNTPAFFGWPVSATEATGALQHSWIQKPFGTSSTRLVSRLIPNYPNCFRVSWGPSVPTICIDLHLCFGPHICSLPIRCRQPLWVFS